MEQTVEQHTNYLVIEPVLSGETVEVFLGHGDVEVGHLVVMLMMMVNMVNMLMLAMLWYWL